MAVHTPDKRSGRQQDADGGATTVTDDVRAAAALPAPEQKHEYVRTMFDAIAPRYDLLNSVLSVRLHHGWRRAAVRQTAVNRGGVVLDICTGTGDLAFELAHRVGVEGEVVGTDFSQPMLLLGQAKAAKRSDPEQRDIRWALADAQALPFPAHAFDAVTVGFGIRNVADIQRGIDEMARVTRPGGRVVILEFNQPQNRLIAGLYSFYSFRLLPLLGGLISGRRSAYAYLPSSVAAFHSREAIAGLMRNAGLESIEIEDLTFGTVVIHSGVKPSLGQPVGEAGSRT